MPRQNSWMLKASREPAYLRRSILRFNGRDIDRAASNYSKGRFSEMTRFPRFDCRRRDSLSLNAITEPLSRVVTVAVRREIAIVGSIDRLRFFFSRRERFRWRWDGTRYRLTIRDKQRACGRLEIGFSGQVVSRRLCYRQETPFTVSRIPSLE